LTRRSLDDWLEYISAQHPATIALGLDRVRAVGDRLQLPWNARTLSPGPVTLIIGGTNGKGSTCAMLEAILLEAGYDVGLYTSPHLLRYNERVRFKGDEVSDADLVQAFERVEEARKDVPLTYFEFGTLAALTFFGEIAAQVVILEVGLGGRLDAVNIVDADVSAVVSVDLDHQAFLGDNREDIGFEKAGIYRSGRPALFGDFDPPGRLVDHAEKIGAQLQILGRHFRYEAQERQWDFIGRKGAKRALPMPALRGAWQLKNASVALAALDEVADRVPVSLGEIKRGLLAARIEGRLQVLPGRPSIVLDVAHNPHAARSLAAGLGDMGFYENTLAVFAMLADKDIGGVVDAMRGRIDKWYVTAAHADRAASAGDVLKVLGFRGLAESARTFATVASALEAARRDAGPNDRIVVFGSFYTVAEALRAAR
jgi:dihydrofolate synthase/folylpolyglutamate synthase